VERRAFLASSGAFHSGAIAEWDTSKSCKHATRLQNCAKCTGRRQLRTRTGGWQSGRDADSVVGTIVAGYACSDCAAWVAAAPLLVSRGGGTRAESK